MTALGVVDEAGLTQTGHVRRNNEDSYLIRGDLFMIADGMGGAAAGEVASAMCAQAFAEIDLIRSRGDGALRDAIVVANTRIHERAASDPAASGMGTTVTAALVESDGRVALANVGDSRAYLLREGTLRRLTEDHSVVAELVATGQISDWEASSHPQRNVVTRVLGAEATVQVDTFWLEAQDGDVVLLCSDGLTDMVAEEEFAKLLAADKSCEQIARDLVRAALAQGGEDNVTTVLFRIGPEPGAGGRAAANGADPGSRPGAGRRGGPEPQAHRAAGDDDAGRDRDPGRGQHLLPALGALRRCRRVERPCRRLPGPSHRPVRRRQALPRGVGHAHRLRGAQPGHPQEAVRPHDPLRRERPLGGRERRQLWPMRSARFRELWNLLAVAVLTGVGFLSVYTARQQEITSTSLIYAAFFLALYFVAHLGLRAGLPDADPWLLPLSALLTAMGLTEIYRLNPLLARDQSIWIVVGLGGFLALILLVGDQRKLESYKYTLGVAAVAMLVITMLVGTTINGAKLWLRVGGIQVQPGEFAKLLLVIFLAGYLREKRELLTMAHRRILGVGLPAARHLGPLLAMTGVALGVVAVMNDMGTALLLYGIFLAMVYVATGRQLYTVAGLALFVGGSFLVYHLTPHVQERFQVWLDPWKTPHTNGYQIIQSIESIADGGIFGSGPGPQLPGVQQRQLGDPGRPDRRHLCGVGQRDRAGRSRRDAADLPAVRLPRLQDRERRR